MSTAVKVWAQDESQPPEGKVSNAPDAPPNWFKEEPQYAAELYGLERGEGKYTISVIDDEGTRFDFPVEVRHEIHARVGAPLIQQKLGPIPTTPLSPLPERLYEMGQEYLKKGPGAP